MEVYLEMFGVSAGTVATIITAYWLIRRYIKNSSCHVEGPGGIKIDIDTEDLDKGAREIEDFLNKHPELRKKLSDKLSPRHDKEIV
jgi:hypothetical protein